MAIQNEQYDMIMMELLERTEKTVSVLNGEYVTIRAGRANPHILDKVLVDYYGTPSPINQVGNISVVEGRCLVIAPWDASMLKIIEKQLLVENLGITPVNDGKVIRLVFPALTEERRKALVKDIHKIAEVGMETFETAKYVSNELNIIKEKLGNICKISLFCLIVSKITPM